MGEEKVGGAPMHRRKGADSCDRGAILDSRQDVAPRGADEAGPHWAMVLYVWYAFLYGKLDAGSSPCCRSRTRIATTDRAKKAMQGTRDAPHFWC